MKQDGTEYKKSRERERYKHRVRADKKGGEQEQSVHLVILSIDMIQQKNMFLFFNDMPRFILSRFASNKRIYGSNYSFFFNSKVTKTMSGIINALFGHHKDKDDKKHAHKVEKVETTTTARSSTGSCAAHTAISEDVRVHSVVSTETNTSVSVRNTQKIADLMNKLGKY